MNSSAKISKSISTAIKMTAFAFIASLCVFTTSSANAKSSEFDREPARLKENVVVDNRLVTLGDLFENAGPVAHKAVFRSPSIGQSGTIRAERVVEAAQKAGLVLIDLNNVQIVNVQRDSELVTEGDILDALKAQLRAKGYVSATGRVDVELSTRIADQHASPDQVQPFDIRNIRFDRTSGRFNANLLITGRTDLGTIRLAGTAIETVLTPVMTRNMQRGDIVTESDVVMTPLPKQQAMLGKPAEISTIIGLAARQNLRPGTIANAAYFTAPNIVERSDIVTILFKAGNLTLSMRGKALTDGAKGDVISVQNHQSNRIIRAEVVGPSLLKVTSPQNTISALGANLQ